MRRTIPSLAALGLLLGLAQAARAGEDEAAAIIDKAVKAHFPKGLDTKNQGLRSRSKGTLHVMGLDLEFTQELAVQSPNNLPTNSRIAAGVSYSRPHRPVTSWCPGGPLCC